MSDADDVMSYLTEFKPGDQVRIMKHQPGGQWPPHGTRGRIVMRTQSDHKWIVEYLHEGQWACSNFFDDQMVFA